MLTPTIFPVSFHRPLKKAHKLIIARSNRKTLLSIIILIHSLMLSELLTTSPISANSIRLGMRTGGSHRIQIFRTMTTTVLLHNPPDDHQAVHHAGEIISASGPPAQTYQQSSLAQPGPSHQQSLPATEQHIQPYGLSSPELVDTFRDYDMPSHPGQVTQADTQFPPIRDLSEGKYVHQHEGHVATPVRRFHAPQQIESDPISAQAWVRQSMSTYIRLRNEYQKWPLELRLEAARMIESGMLNGCKLADICRDCSAELDIAVQTIRRWWEETDTIFGSRNQS